MDLICCSKRPSRRTTGRGSSLFSEDRRFGGANSKQVAGEVSNSAAEALNTSPETKIDGRPINNNTVVSDSSKEDLAEAFSASAKLAGSTPATGARGGRGDGRAVDPFLMENSAEAAEEAAALARLEGLASLVRGEVRVKRQPPSKSHGSLLPADAPSEVSMELQVPGQRSSRTWAASELALWPSEAAGERKTPLAAARLLRVTKVRHLDKHDDGCCVRLRVQQGEKDEVCEDILVHASEAKAKACSEALVEAINLVRSMVGRSVHEKSGG